MATLEGFVELARGIYLEGLIFDFSRDAIWYSDVIAGGVHAVAEGRSPPALDPDRMWTGGLLFDARGLVLSTGVGGIRWNDPDSPGNHAGALRRSGLA